MVFRRESYPTRDCYPFNLPVFQNTPFLDLTAPVTLFVGENGTGKSALLEAIARRCRIHIWANGGGSRLESNPYEDQLYRFIDVHWTQGEVPGSFFAAEIFRGFAELLDEFAETDRGQLDYFGGRSLLVQPHGQSLLSFFTARYRIKGLYLLDEPETALSPRSPLRFVNLVGAMARAGHAQFILCTHSPILLASPGVTIYSLDHCPIQPVPFESTDHCRLYKSFMADPGRCLGDAGTQA